jgi:GNAT superfamily N-acetyltransferase
MIVRALAVDDYLPIVSQVNDWWGGRQVSQLLPRLFFEHFTNTSFVLEGEAGQVFAFLIAFVSQTEPDLAYVHFGGVDPRERGQGFGRKLYMALFDRLRTLGCRRVRAITSPVNHGSVSFHRKLGFHLLPGDDVINGYPVQNDLAGPGQPRICFEILLNTAHEAVAVQEDVEIGN